MSFKEEILSNIKTPKEVQEIEREYIVNYCRELARNTFENIKTLLINAASNGKYKWHNGYRIIKVEPVIVKSSYSAEGFKEYIENDLLLSTIDVSYTSYWKSNFLGQVTKTIFTYFISIKDKYKYQAFMQELHRLATEEGISIYPKMKFMRYLSDVSQYQEFPGILTSSIDGMDDEFDHPKDWVKFFLIAKIKV